MQSGANQVIDIYEKQCLEDNPDECIAVGKNAAQGEFCQFTQHFFELCVLTINILIWYISEIAFQFCPFGPSPFAQPDYKEKCREVATGVCEGAGESAYYIFQWCFFE